jgi:hypothetical protein
VRPRALEVDARPCAEGGTDDADRAAVHRDGGSCLLQLR